MEPELSWNLSANSGMESKTVAYLVKFSVSLNICMKNEKNEKISSLSFSIYIFLESSEEKKVISQPMSMLI